MLVSNTMRFGTDNTGDFTPLPRMKLLLNGTTTDIKLTDFPISSPCIAVRINGGIFICGWSRPMTPLPRRFA